jgi:hypothetical protein
MTHAAADIHRGPARHALPAIYPFREFAQAGGLMSYGSGVGYSVAPMR